MGIALEHVITGGQFHLFEQFQATFAGLGMAHALMDKQAFADLLLDGVQGIEGGQRLLENHPDTAAAQGPLLLVVELQQVLTLESHAVRFPGGAVGQQVEYRQGR